MKRTPTASEVDDLKRLIASAGGKPQLRKWISDLPAPLRKRGRPPVDKYSELDAILLERVYDAIFFDRCSSATAVISGIVEKDYQASWGASQEAVVKRLLAKAKAKPEWREIGLMSRLNRSRRQVVSD